VGSNEGEVLWRKGYLMNNGRGFNEEEDNGMRDNIVIKIKINK
jgi:hypothetical protein